MFCKISLSHPSQRSLPCCITGKTALALDCTFPAGWGHKNPREETPPGPLGPSKVAFKPRSATVSTISNLKRSPVAAQLDLCWDGMGAQRGGGRTLRPQTTKTVTDLGREGKSAAGLGGETSS